MALTDDFNRANNAALGTAAGGWSWTETSNTGDWEILSNTAHSLGASGGEEDARAESDLASGDHYAQLTVTTANNNFIGPAVRFNSSARTYYTGFVNTATDSYRISKVVAGVRTDLVTGSATVNVGDVIRLEVAEGAGSCTLTLKVNGTTINSTTDSSIANTNVRAGMWAFSIEQVDDWSADVLVAAVVPAADIFPRRFRNPFASRVGPRHPLYRWRPPVLDTGIAPAVTAAKFRRGQFPRTGSRGVAG